MQNNENIFADISQVDFFHEQSILDSDALATYRSDTFMHERVLCFSQLLWRQENSS